MAGISRSGGRGRPGVGALHKAIVFHDQEDGTAIIDEINCAYDGHDGRFNGWTRSGTHEDNPMVLPGEPVINSEYGRDCFFLFYVVLAMINSPASFRPCFA